MTIPASVTRWKSEIELELDAGKYPFPIELVYSLISYESNGVAGAKNEKSGASGLMQVMPGTLDWYNKQTYSAISLDTLRSSTRTAARAQIRVGLWVLGQFWKSAYKWLRESANEVPVTDLVHFADAFYAAGPGKVRELGEALPARTWVNWQTKYPTSNITAHADRVWARTAEQNPRWDLDKIDAYVEGRDALVAKTSAKGLIFGLIILFIAALALRWFEGDKKHGDIS